MVRMIRRSLIATTALALLLAAVAPASPDRLAALAREQEAAQRQLRQAEDAAAIAAGQLEELKATYGPEAAQVQAAQRELDRQQQRVVETQDQLSRLGDEAERIERQMQADAETQRGAVTSDVEERLQAARETARELAASEDPVAKLSDAIADAALEQLRVQYRLAALRVATARRLAELGRGETSEVFEAEAAADAALADVREAELQRMLDRVQRERTNGAAAAGAGGAATTSPSADDDAEQAIQADRQVLQAEYFRGYLDTVRRYGELASDPAAARVAAVITATDILADRPPSEAVAYFQEMLNELPADGSPADAAVRRIICFQIVDFQRQAGDEAAALEQLRTLAIEPAKPGPQQAKSASGAQGS